MKLAKFNFTKTKKLNQLTHKKGCLPFGKAASFVNYLKSSVQVSKSEF